VLATFLVKSIKSRAPSLVIATTTEGFQSTINLDTRNNASFVKNFDKGLAFSGRLVKSFFEENCTGNIVSKLRRGEKKLTPLQVKRFGSVQNKHYVSVMQFNR
jgi:hypothetical protein